MKKLLFQFDGDRLPSPFDRIVGYDGGADEVLAYGGVTTEEVRALVYSAVFPRGPKDLKNTALFIGGSDVTLAERMLAEVRQTLFDPFRISVMLDPNGSNTTAAAAVLKMVRAVGDRVKGSRAVVLAGTGPVGTRAAGLFARLGAEVRITSRTALHAHAAADYIRERFGAEVDTVSMDEPDALSRALSGAELVLASGPTGIQLLPREAWQGHPELKVVADVNAVPPLGVEGVDANDDGVDKGGVVAFGALALGNLKMKLHKACIGRLFERNDQVFDAEAIYDLAADL